jgi:tetratricopeptide (TPR) repeat protein
MPVRNNQSRISRAVGVGTALLALLFLVGQEGSVALAADRESDPDRLIRLDRMLGEDQAAQVVAEVRKLLAAGAGEPRHAWLYQQRLAAALLVLERPDEALPVLESALAVAPQDPALHLNLARALQQLGRLGRAVAEYETAIQLAPDRPLWRLEFAEAMMSLGIRRDALVQIRLARSACGDCPEALRAEAVYHQEVGQLAASVEPLDRLFAVQPLPTVRQMLVHALWGAGESDRVIAVLDTVADGRLTGAEVMILLQAERRLGRGERARTWVAQEAPRVADGWRPGHEFWAIASEVCLGTGQDELALNAIERALALAPESAVYHHNRAAILLRLDREDEARLALETAQRLDPSLQDAATPGPEVR